MAKRWTEEELKSLNDWYGNVELSEISNRIGRTEKSIRTKASEIGIAKGRNEWSGDDILFLQENYLLLGAEEVARKLKRTTSSVHSKIIEVGGGRKSIGPRVRWDEESLQYLRENYQKKTFEELSEHLNRTPMAIQVRASMLGMQRYIDPFPFFETWSEKLAYIVGFWAADGWASKRGPESIRIGFAQKEKGILESIKDVLGTGRIVRKGWGGYVYYFQSVKVYNWLCALFEMDICNKSNTISWPNIPNGYVVHFIRGAFDGDGSIMRQGERLWIMSYATGSGQFARSMAKSIELFTGIKLGVGINKINVYHARCGGIKAVCLADWLYRDSSIALNRKMKLAQQAMETVGMAWKKSLTPKMREMFPHIISRYKIL